MWDSVEIRPRALLWCREKGLLFLKVKVEDTCWGDPNRTCKIHMQCWTAAAHMLQMQQLITGSHQRGPITCIDLCTVQHLGWAVELLTAVLFGLHSSFVLSWKNMMARTFVTVQCITVHWSNEVTCFMDVCVHVCVVVVCLLLCRHTPCSYHYCVPLQHSADIPQHDQLQVRLRPQVQAHVHTCTLTYTATLVKTCILYHLPQPSLTLMSTNMTKVEWTANAFLCQDFQSSQKLRASSWLLLFQRMVCASLFTRKHMLRMYKGETDFLTVKGTPVGHIVSHHAPCFRSLKVTQTRIVYRQVITVLAYARAHLTERVHNRLIVFWSSMASYNTQNLAGR